MEITRIIITLNDMVAIKPIKSPQPTEQESNPRSRLAIHNKLSGALIASEVVFDGPDGIEIGDLLYFRQDILNHPEIRKILTIDDKEFIVLHKNLVVARTTFSNGYKY
jgi:hypothetical protein